MLAEPGHEWTIDSLALAASMSRATFMRAFVKVAGVSPWVLLTQLRMERAFNLLRQSRLSLIDIAAQVGYQSQAAFSKNSGHLRPSARAHAGSPPHACRRRACSEERTGAAFIQEAR